MTIAESITQARVAWISGSSGALSLLAAVQGLWDSNATAVAVGVVGIIGAAVAGLTSTFRTNEVKLNQARLDGAVKASNDRADRAETELRESIRREARCEARCEYLAARVAELTARLTTTPSPTRSETA